MRQSEALARAAFLVLLSLVDRPRHGLAIIDHVEDASNGGCRMGPGTLHGTLQTLVATGLITDAEAPPEPGADDSRRRHYRLTSRGETVLTTDASLRTLVDAATAQRILGQA
jgi:DNA-binding PadR family transcriptional regulator